MIQEEFVTGKITHQAKLARRKLKWPGRVAQRFSSFLWRQSILARFFLPLLSMNKKSSCQAEQAHSEDTRNIYTTTKHAKQYPFQYDTASPAVLKQIEHEYHSSIAIDSWKTREK